MKDLIKKSFLEESEVLLKSEMVTLPGGNSLSGGPTGPIGPVGPSCQTTCAQGCSISCSSGCSQKRST